MSSRLLDHLEKLKVFLAVADAGSFHGGARAVHLTQPSLSRAVEALEGALDVRLFRRTTRGVSLTAAGAELHRFAAKLVADSRDVELRMKHPNDHLAGSVHVGTYGYLTELVWSRVFGRLLTDHPALHVGLSVRSGFAPQAAHLQQEFDLIVDVEPLASPEVSSSVLFVDDFAFYCAPELAAGPKPRELQALIYVPTAIDGSRTTLRQHLALFGVKAERTIEVDTFETARGLARSRLGVTILPHSFGAADVGAGLLKRVRPPGAPRGAFGPHRVCLSTLLSREGDARLALLAKLLAAPRGR